MKKIFSLALCAILATGVLTACTEEREDLSNRAYALAIVNGYEGTYSDFAALLERNGYNTKNVVNCEYRLGEIAVRFLDGSVFSFLPQAINLHYSVGDTLPNLDLGGVGVPVRVDRHQFTVIAYWRYGDKKSEDNLLALDQLVATYPAYVRGLAIHTSDFNIGEQIMRQRLNDLGVSYLECTMDERDTLSAFSPSRDTNDEPLTVIVSPKGIIENAFNGAYDFNGLESITRDIRTTCEAIPDDLTVYATEALYPVVSAAAEEYAMLNDGKFSVFVEQADGAPQTENALCVCWEAEASPFYEFIPLGGTPVVIVANEKAPGYHISQQELFNLYAKGVAIGPITSAATNFAQSGKDFAAILKDENGKTLAQAGTDPVAVRYLSNTQKALDFVRGNYTYLTFAPYEAYRNNSKGLRALSVDGNAPDAQGMCNGYPYGERFGFSGNFSKMDEMTVNFYEYLQSAHFAAFLPETVLSLENSYTPYVYYVE